MPVVTLLILLIVFGAVLFIVERHVPMDPIFKIAIRVVVVVALIWYLVALVLPTLNIPPLR